MSDLNLIGKSLPRKDGPDKTTGKARYTADMQLPGMLIGGILRSPHPHAKIVNIDTARAEKLPGVKAIITGKDTRGRPAIRRIRIYWRMMWSGMSGKRSPRWPQPIVGF